MRAKLIIEGREFPVDINDPELQKILAPKPKHTGYERVDTDEYYYVVSTTALTAVQECHIKVDDELYEYANYYSDKTVAENNARADKLMRQLRRFAVEHREIALDWDRPDICKYYIDYSHGMSIFNIFSNESYQTFGTVYFDSKETAQLALDTFRDEPIWYFTEYKDSL